MSKEPDRLLTTMRGFELAFSLGLLCFVMGCGRRLQVSLNESDRIQHPDGFSVIAPPGWHTEVVVLGPETTVPNQQIVCSSEEPSQRRVGTIAVLSKLNSEPDLSKAVLVKSNVGEMHMTSNVLKGSFDDPSRTKITTFRETGGSWYRLDVQSTADKEDVVNLCIQVVSSIRGS